MTGRVLDTNAISALMRHEPAVVRRYDMEMQRRSLLLLCPVVLYEIERGLLALPEATGRRGAFQKLKASLTYVEMDQRVWLRAAELWANERRVGRVRSEDDLLIAAFASVHDAAIVTRNTQDFEGLAVPLEDWTRSF